jgi:thiol:disulfide interchange protein
LEISRNLVNLVAIKQKPLIAPKRFQPFFDYDESIAYAHHAGEPVMIDFTGYACVNCLKNNNK